MASIIAGVPAEQPIDRLSGTPRAHALDRWIYVVMAGFFILIVLVGFIPDSVMKVQMVRAGLRPPFPLVLHFHAVLMGGFLLFLLLQTSLVATGRCALHRKIGPIGGALAAALVVVGIVLAPTMYHQVHDGLAVAPPEAHGAIRDLLARLDNILLLQMQAGVLFSLFIVLALRARSRDAGLHKRLMIFAPAMALGAAFARMPWIPDTMPGSPVSILGYQILALAPLFVWDVMRNRRVHQAYWLLAACYLPFAVADTLLWDTRWWHDTARWIMGV